MDEKNKERSLTDDDIRTERGVLRRSFLEQTGLAVAAATAAAFYGAQSARAKDTDKREVADSKRLHGRRDSDRAHFRDPK